MTEPNRIGLTPKTDSQLDHLLEELNPEPDEEGEKIVKFDIYRLAVALGVSRKDLPAPLSEKSTSSLRVNELDPDGFLKIAVENLGLICSDSSVYEFVEQLAERGISEFFEKYQQTGQLPLEEYFEE
ncbi:MAG: hypothetical protein OXD32_08275 [Endozoicomonadaceae bacterium]|nr:hypothetical protein [Endozoicomonadaceae bacterium]